MGDPMCEFSCADLTAAEKAILSTIRKNEKVLETLSAKQPPRTSLIALVSKQLDALRVAASFVASELDQTPPPPYSQAELDQADRTLTHLHQQVEKAQSKFAEGTAQRTLASRRIQAFQLSLSLIRRAAGA